MLAPRSSPALPDRSRRFRRSAALVGLALGLLAGLGGCRSLARQPVAENVVEARTVASRGIEAMQQGRYDQAEELLAKAIQICPVDERSRSRYAELLWRRGQPESALRQMEEAVRLSGGDPTLRVQLGQMYLAYGDVPKALVQARQAIKADFRSASAWALQGDCLSATGKLDEALTSYHRALALEEHYPHVQLAVADVYSAQQKPQRALATLMALEDRYGPGQAPAEVLVKQGQALKQLQRYDDAAEVLETAIVRGSTLAETYYELAEALFQSGDLANARLAVAAALEQLPQHEPSLHLREALETQTLPLTATTPPPSYR